jgi:hypothetical protein
MKVLAVFILSIIFINLIESRKKKKKPKAPKQPSNPLDRRPSNVKPELYCDACQAMVIETIKELRGKKKESDVINVIDSVCDQEKYYTYRKIFLI